MTKATAKVYPATYWLALNVLKFRNEMDGPLSEWLDSLAGSENWTPGEMDGGWRATVFFADLNIANRVAASLQMFDLLSVWPRHGKMLTLTNRAFKPRKIITKKPIGKSKLSRVYCCHMGNFRWPIPAEWVDKRKLRNSKAVAWLARYGHSCKFTAHHDGGFILHSDVAQDDLIRVLLGHNEFCNVIDLESLPADFDMSRMAIYWEHRKRSSRIHIDREAPNREGYTYFEQWKAAA